MQKLPFDLVVFDLAGTTVVDTGDIVAVCLVRAVEQQTTITVSKPMAVSLMGIPKPLAIRRLLEDAGHSPDQTTVDRVHERFRSIMLEHYRNDPSVREIPGTTRVFTELRELGVKIGIDTGFDRAITDAILDRLGWRAAGLIDASAASDEVPAGRPAPFMIYQLMGATAVTDVARVVKVGDTPSDLKMGHNARCGRNVGVCGGSHSRQQLLEFPHTDLIADVNELIETLAHDPRPDLQLHTPGPANVSQGVRDAMNRDIGAWDSQLINLVRDMRSELLSVAGVSKADGWECVLMQGSGTFGVEAVIGTALPRDAKLLVAVNGAYGQRIAAIAERLNIAHTVLSFDEDQSLDAHTILHAVRGDPAISHVAVVHCETTTGMMNDIESVGRALRDCGRDLVYIVDAMSSFGAYPIDLEACGIDWIVASSNKCVQGTPGFAFAIARKSRLDMCNGHARSLSLDLFDQWRGFETHGRFRFTPPTHVLLAFKHALTELTLEGGPLARYRRYCSLQRRLAEGMTRRGYKLFIDQARQSPIITTFLYPEDPNFNFDALYSTLHRMGFVIYPGKLTKVGCFRIGHIGNLYPRDIDRLLDAIDAAAEELGFDPSLESDASTLTPSLAK